MAGSEIVDEFTSPYTVQDVPPAVQAPSNATPEQKSEYAARESFRARASEAIAGQRAAEAGYNRALSQNMVESPTYEQESKWSNSKEHNDAQLSKEGVRNGFALLMIAIAGSFAMRTGANGAMNALASALKGWKDGDKEKWDTARADYDRNIQIIKDHNKRLYDDWRENVKQRTGDINRDTTAMRLLYVQHGLSYHNAIVDIQKADARIQAITAHTQKNATEILGKKIAAGKDPAKVKEWEKDSSDKTARGITPDTFEEFLNKHYPPKSKKSGFASEIKTGKKVSAPAGMPQSLIDHIIELDGKAQQVGNKGKMFAYDKAKNEILEVRYKPATGD